MQRINNGAMVLLLMTIVQVAHSGSAFGSYRIGEDRHHEIKPLKNLPQGGTLNMTFKSAIDGSIQPLLIRVPKDYTPVKSWPLLVTLHGFGDGPILAPEIEKIVQVGPYGRGSVWYEGIGERDVFECLEIAKRLFSVDSDRVYLCGFSMGGTATFDLGFKHPDVWAACVPVCGRCDSPDLVSNARYLPFWINTGSRDIMIPLKYSKAAFDKARQLGFSQWKYTEHKTMGHDFSVNWKEIEEWLLTKKRITNPKMISFRTKDIRFNRAYCIEITKIKRYGGITQIDIDIEGQKIYVKSKNVSNYTMRLNDALINTAQRAQVIENGVLIHDGFLDGDGCFVKASGDNRIVSKRAGLSGPLWDIYSDFCLLIYGTNSKDKSLVKASRRCAERFAYPSWMSKVNFKVVSDKEVSKKDVAENNIVFFGNPETNEVLARMLDALPIKVVGKDVLVRDRKFSGDNVGCILIYPNPMNQAKYVAVFSGFTADTINCFDRIWPRFKSVPKDVDFGVFEFQPGDNSVMWRLKGIFGSEWDWQ